MANKKRVDILDLLPGEAASEVDRLGYRFLKQHGYDVQEKDIPTKAERKEIKEEMRRRNETLKYKGYVDHENKKLLIWFVLYRNGKKTAQSRGVTFVFREGE